MAGGFKPINLLPDADQLQKNLDDTDYWMRMKESAVFKEYDIISSVAFIPKLPHHLSITTSNKAAVFDTSISQPIWQQNNFKSSVHGVKFRRDGLLMGMGSADGFVRFFDIQQKNIPSKHALRLFQAHDCEVRSLAFASLHTCATFADDGDIRLWDISLSNSTKPIWEVKGAHSDRIRAATSSAVSDNLLLSGSYDHSVKLWDTRSDASSGPLVSIDHGHPVEALLFHPNNRIAISGGGNVVKFWDISAGSKKPVKILETHSRTVTSLCFAGQGQFLLSAGLDRRIHAYRIDRGDFVLVNTLNTADSVLSLDVSPNDECMGFSMNNLLCIYRRHPKQHVYTDDSTNKILIGDGKRVKKAKESIVYHQERGNEAVRLEIISKNVDQLHLGTFDRLLRKHQYRKIIDQAFANKDLIEKKPGVVVAVLDQIRLAGQLQMALAGRHGKDLASIIKFVAQNLFHSAFFDVLHDVANTVNTMYTTEALTNAEIGAIARLKSQISNEVRCERQLLKNLGILNSLINVSFENEQQMDNTQSVFGDLLITPKLFSLKKNQA